MNYLQDKKTKKYRFSHILIFIGILLVLFYFRSGIYRGFAYMGQNFFRPVLILGGNAGEKFAGIGSFFVSKSSLYKENVDLKSKIETDRFSILNYNSVLEENTILKEILDRKIENNFFTLAAILAKPNQSPYDTLLIDIGEKNNIKTGNIVFAQGNVPIGAIAETYPYSSKVLLFSSSGEKTQVVVDGRNIFMELVGRGGGNFEMIIPRDFTPTKEDRVVLPGISSYVVGIVESTISDPRDPFIKALLVSPVNIQELKFVQVEHQR